MDKLLWMVAGILFLAMGIFGLTGPDASIRAFVSLAVSLCFFFLAFRNKSQVETKTVNKGQTEQLSIPAPIPSSSSKPPNIDFSIEEGVFTSEQMERWAAKIYPCRFCHQRRMHLNAERMTLFCKNNECPAFRSEFHLQVWNDWTWEADQFAYCDIYKSNLGLRRDGPIWTEYEEGKYPRFIYLKEYYQADFWVSDQDENTPVEETRPGVVMYTFLREDDGHKFEDGKIAKAYVYMKWQPKNTRSTDMTNDNY